MNDAHERALLWASREHRIEREEVKKVVETYLNYRADDSDDPRKFLAKTPKWFTDKHPDYHPEKMTEIWTLIWSWAPKL